MKNHRNLDTIVRVGNFDLTLSLASASVGTKSGFTEFLYINIFVCILSLFMSYVS